MVVIPAEYETVAETYVSQEASTRLEIVPATYRTVTETIIIQPARVDIDVIPAVYETRSEQVLISPAREEWKPGSQAINSGAFTGGTINSTTTGQFTVFNGVSQQTVESTQTYRGSNG